MHQTVVVMAAPERRNMFQRLENILKQYLLPILFPRRCPFCKRILPYSSQICDSCRRRLPLIHSPICSRCGKPLNHEQQDLCYDCRIFPKSFYGGLSLFLYNSMTQSAMIDYKYHNRRYLTDFFVHAICSIHLQQIKAWNLQAIVPIPIHKNKRKKRGYNQAELLAKQLAYHLNLPCYSDFIIRQIDTLPQKQFSPQARLSNLSKAFALNPRYQHKNLNLERVLLVDDIYTTGATMETCARILIDAGIHQVYIYSICIGVSRDDVFS